MDKKITRKRKIKQRNEGETEIKKNRDEKKRTKLLKQ